MPTVEYFLFCFFMLTIFFAYWQISFKKYINFFSPKRQFLFFVITLMVWELQICVKIISYSHIIWKLLVLRERLSITIRDCFFLFSLDQLVSFVIIERSQNYHKLCFIFHNTTFIDVRLVKTKHKVNNKKMAISIQICPDLNNANTISYLLLCFFVNISFVLNSASILYRSNIQCKTPKLPLQDISIDILDIRISMYQIIFATCFWDNEYVKNEIP